MDAHLIGREFAVPGSTANLGPGFDAVALALEIYIRASVRRVDPTRRNEVHCAFQNLTLDGDNLVAGAYRAAAAAEQRDGPSLSVDVVSDIPLRAGLGSSAAAIVLGLKLYEAATAPLGLARALTLAATIEGHPDNTSASLLGGLVVSCQNAGGDVVAVAAPWPSEVHVVVATPAVALETKRARNALPETVPFEDAIFNVQRGMLLIEAVHQTDLGAIREAFRDRLHQPYRATLVPGFDEAQQLAHPSLLGICLSGAGPSIAAFVHGDTEAVRSMFAGLYGRLGLEHTVRELAVHQPEGV